MVVAGLLATPLFLQSLAAAQRSQQRTHYEWAMISSDNNRPRLRIDTTYNLILAKLHLDTPPALFAREVGISSVELEQRLEALVTEGLAARDGRSIVRPAVPVITARDAQRSLRVDASIVGATTDAIARDVPDIRRTYARLPGFRHVPFERASLLILSDVLLDNWQIDHVEESFINAQRPKRAGGRYYYAVFERNNGDPVDAFGIYGNHSQDFDGVGASLYGNERYNGPPNLDTIADRALIEDFDFPPATQENAARAELANDLIRLSAGTSELMSTKRLAGLSSLGLLDASGRTAVPIVSPMDETGLQDIAARFGPTLNSLLGRYRERLETQYRGSPYAREAVAWPEFTIWWYHFFYTAVTNELARRKLIEMPPNGTLTYLITD